jgi:hypothetical protein
MVFNPGDVLLYTAPAWKFSNIIPKLIRLITGNKITHVALYINQEGNKHIILDVSTKGIYTLSMTEAELYNRVDDFCLAGIARLNNLQLPLEQDKLRTATSYFFGKKYGYLTILNLLLQHGMGRLFNKEWKIWFKSNDAYICSESTQLVYEKMGFIFNKPACLVEPDDYLSAPWIFIKP